MIDLEVLCKNAIDLVRSTGERILSERESFEEILAEQKGKNDFVTHFDRLAEQLLVDGLDELLPEAGFIVEENTSNKVGVRYNWIIDPIDGTTNFIHKLSPYCISVALKSGDSIVLGIVYEMGYKECFYAWEGSPAYLNGKVIQVSNANLIKDCLIATGFSISDYQNKDSFFNTLLYFSNNSHGLRRMGAAAMNLAYVACGRLDAFYKMKLKSWDVAAGSLIVKQAGGKVSDYFNGDNYIFNGEILASNGFIHSEMLDVINKHK